MQGHPSLEFDEEWAVAKVRQRFLPTDALSGPPPTHSLHCIVLSYSGHSVQLHGRYLTGRGVCKRIPPLQSTVCLPLSHSGSPGVNLPYRAVRRSRRHTRRVVAVGAALPRTRRRRGGRRGRGTTRMCGGEGRAGCATLLGHLCLLFLSILALPFCVSFASIHRRFVCSFWGGGGAQRGRGTRERASERNEKPGDSLARLLARSLAQAYDTLQLPRDTISRLRGGLNSADGVRYTSRPVFTAS